MKGLLIGLAIGVLLLPATVSATQQVYDRTFEVDNRFWMRYDDPDFKVKCWRYDGGNDGGVSCLPWDEVKERNNG